MTDPYTTKLDIYLDGELPADEMRELDAHVRDCPPCAADVLARVQMKRAMQSAGKRYTPDTALRARIQQQLAPRRSVFRLLWFAVPAFLLFLAAVGLFLFRSATERVSDHVYSELTDLYVATLASANPVDVISTDRHTVKPWFQGKLPFTFNLPELTNSDFTLLGGRVAYLGQSPGAQLIYQIRKHQISVFIFQENATSARIESASKKLSFAVDSWSKDGLRYFIIGDASDDDIHRLADLLKAVA